METAAPLQKEAPNNAGIANGSTAANPLQQKAAGGKVLQTRANPLQQTQKSTQNPLQVKQPGNNPLQFTRKQAQAYGFKIDDDLVKFYKDERVMTSRKLLFILINNHELTADDADYIDLEQAKAMMPDYDDESLSDATITYLEWAAEKEEREKQQQSEKEEKTEPDKTEKAKGVLPALGLDNRHITLIGTTHGDDQPDYTGNIPGSTPNDAAIVLEYPPLTNTGRDTYTPGDIKKVNDKTQASLATNANGRKVIGGDGRKAFDKDQNLHSITIRHKLDDAFVINDEFIEDEKIHNLATDYVHAALGLKETDVATVSDPIEKLVKYLDGTISLLVLVNTFYLVRERSKNLSNDRKKAIAGKVIQALDQDLAGLNDRYRSHLAAAEKQLAAIPSDNEREKEKIRIDKATAFEFTGNKISFLHDAVCNVLLFTEVIASDKNMVVAFGAHHIAPLQELIAEVANPDAADLNKPAKDEEKTGSLPSEPMDLKERLHQLLLKFLQTEMNKDPLYFNNCLIEAILNKLKIQGEARALIIEKIRKSLEGSGIPKGEMLHATAGVLNLIALEIFTATGTRIGTVTIQYNHIGDEIQKNFESMDNAQLNDLLDNIKDTIHIGEGENIEITHTGFAHFK
jgi:hypothetical protein